MIQVNLVDCQGLLYDSGLGYIDLYLPLSFVKDFAVRSGRFLKESPWMAVGRGEDGFEVIA